MEVNDGKENLFIRNLSGARDWHEVKMLDSQLQDLNRTFGGDDMSPVDEEAYETMRKINRKMRNNIGFQAARLNNN